MHSTLHLGPNYWREFPLGGTSYKVLRVLGFRVCSYKGIPMYIFIYIYTWPLGSYILGIQGLCNVPTW